MEFDKIKKMLMAVLCISESDIHTYSLLREDLGADSLDLYDIFNAIEKEYHVVITSEDLERIHTVEDIEKYIRIIQG